MKHNSVKWKSITVKWSSHGVSWSTGSLADVLRTSRSLADVLRPSSCNSMLIQSLVLDWAKNTNISKWNWLGQLLPLPFPLPLPHHYHAKLVFESNVPSITQNRPRRITQSKLFFVSSIHLRHQNRSKSVVSWCFEPSQSQGIIHGQESIHQSISYLFSTKVLKPQNSSKSTIWISLDTNRKQNIQTTNRNFRWNRRSCINYPCYKKQNKNKTTYG